MQRDGFRPHGAFLRRASAREAEPVASEHAGAPTQQLRDQRQPTQENQRTEPDRRVQTAKDIVGSRSGQFTTTTFRQKSEITDRCRQDAAPH